MKPQSIEELNALLDEEDNKLKDDVNLQRSSTLKGRPLTPRHLANMRMSHLIEISDEKLGQYLAALEHGKSVSPGSTNKNPGWAATARKFGVDVGPLANLAKGCGRWRFGIGESTLTVGAPNELRRRYTDEDCRRWFEHSVKVVNVVATMEKLGLSSDSAAHRAFRAWLKKTRPEEGLGRARLNKRHG